MINDILTVLLSAEKNTLPANSDASILQIYILFLYLITLYFVDQADYITNVTPLEYYFTQDRSIMAEDAAEAQRLMGTDRYLPQTSRLLLGFL